MTKKIALLGSAPSSLRLAPFQNKEWEMWGCSPGVYGVAPRTDRWFELHRWEPGQTWFSPEYVQWLGNYPGPVYMAEKRGEVPNSAVLPIAHFIKRYGPYFFTSTLSYMFALAIEEGATTIGLWGVDMAANEEYGYQRAGCQFFGMVAASLGIEVGVLPESDLFVPSPLYGVSEIEHGQIKMLARRRELMLRRASVQQELEAKKAETMFLEGALDNQSYVEKTWINDLPWVAPPKAEALAEMLEKVKFPLMTLDPQPVETSDRAGTEAEPKQPVRRARSNGDARP